MRRMLLWFLIFPLFLSAQRREHDIAFKKSIPPGLGEPIRLPGETSFRPGYGLDTTIDYRQRNRIYVITTDAVYRKIFWQYRFTKDSLKLYARDKDEWYYKWMVAHLKDSIPEIDFSVYELVLYSACGQCLAFCKDDSPCHRNACSFHHSWFLRRKGEALITGN